MSVADKARVNGLVLYGAGFWGGVTECIFKIFDVPLSAYCDDDVIKQGKLFMDGSISSNGTPILTLDAAVQSYPDAVYIATVEGGGGNNSPRAVMNRRLKEKGVLTSDSGFHPARYVFLLGGILDKLKTTSESSVNRFHAEHFNNMIVLNHMSNSGDFLFGALLDGHRNIINIPIIGNFVWLKVAYEQRLKYLEGQELVIEAVSQMTPYLISKFDDGSSFTPTYNPTRFYRNEYGAPETCVLLDAEVYTQKLFNELSGRGHVTFSVFLKAIFAAYANAAEQSYSPSLEYWLLFMRHGVNYDLTEMDELIQPRDFKRIEYWFIIREPIQHWYSWLKRFVSDAIPDELLWGWARHPDVYKGVLSGDLGITFEKSLETSEKTVRFVRFEDLKKNMEGTLRAVCNILGIQYDECMLETTVGGTQVYFPASSRDPTTVFATHDKTALNRQDFSELLTSYDIFRLNVAFRRFKLAFGYDCDVPDRESFSDEFLREMYKYPFKFEIAINKASAEALKIGYLKPGERPVCHEYIEKLFLDYLSRDDKPEYFSDIIVPTDE
jgi:hypothetical protein